MVSESFTRQVSPNHTAQVGRGMSMVQSPKFWSKRWMVESRPVRSHRDGSSQASNGMRRLMSAGMVLKMNSPRDSSCQLPALGDVDQVGDDLELGERARRAWYRRRWR